MDASTSLSADLGERLLGLGAQVTTAESCTGGGIAEAITRIAGSSAWFEAGYITYSNAQKTAQLQVPTELFEQVGAVSREVVEAMVRGAQQHSRARFAVAVSGVAGPGGGSADKPVGTVFVAIFIDKHVHEFRTQFKGDANSMRQQAADFIYQHLTDLLSRLQPLKSEQPTISN